MKLPTQVCVLSSKPEPEKINPIGDDLFWKPRGGLWTSTLDDDRGDWVRWLEGEDYSLSDPRWGGDLWLLEPADAKVLVLATPDDYNNICKRFPHPNKDLVKGLRSHEYMADWQRVAKAFDAVHIPNPHPYRLGLFDEYYSAGMFFNTCDAESTCWFRWCFEGDPTILKKEVLSGV